MYLIALICPPLAILLTGKVFQAVLNVPLCLLFFIPGVVHAFAVVSQSNANRHTNKLVKALASSRR